MMERREPRFFYNRPMRGMLLTVVLILVIIAVLLLTAGYLSPGWFNSGTDTMQLQYGLWYGVYCENDECNSKSLSDLFDEDEVSAIEDKLLEYRVEATFSLVFGIAVVVLAVILRRPTNPAIKGIAACLCIVSGLLAVNSSGRLGDEQRRDHDDAEEDGRESPIRFPYSLLLFGLGGILNIIAALLILTDMWITHKSFKYQTYSNREVRSHPFPSEPYQQPIKDYPPTEPVSYGRPNYSDPYSPVRNSSFRRMQDKSYDYPYITREASSRSSHMMRDYARDYPTLHDYQRGGKLPYPY